MARGGAMEPSPEQPCESAEPEAFALDQSTQPSESNKPPQEMSTDSFRERLNAFFWAHSPPRVAEVDTLLAQRVGQEEQLIQRLHAQYGARDFSGTKAIDDLYEHQRYSYLTFSWGSSYPGHLLITDRKCWSNRRGMPSSQQRQELEPHLPVNWHWTSDWEIDLQHDVCDDQGWSYALDFPMLNTLQQTKTSRKRPLSTDHVRRRRWIRTRERNPPEAISRGSASSRQVDTTMELDMRMRRHESLASASSTTTASAQDFVSEAQVCDLQDDAAASIDDAMEEEVTLKLHSLSMDPAQVDTSWRAVINKLEVCYVETNAHDDKRKRDRKITKDKLRQQIRSLERTIASLHTLAKQQQRQHQVDELSTTPSLQEITLRITRAQTKLDALKRLLWFPRASNYSLRFSIDGIFYGCRDFFVEALQAHVGIQLSHMQRPNFNPGEATGINMGGAASIVPVCRLDMTGHLVVCGKHCKVMGDTGTRVPKSVWDRMYLETDFIMHFELVYVLDESSTNATATATGSHSLESFADGQWEFVEKPDANRVELHNFVRKVKGGMDLPEAMVRNLMSQILSGFAREWTLLYLPWEIAYCFRAPPARMDLTGTIRIDGPKVDQVLEKSLQHTSLDDTSDRNTIADQSSPQQPEMLAMVNLLGLTYQQLNLLVALNECRLFPSKFSFQSMVSLCDYYRAFCMHQPSQTVTKLRQVWQEAIELLYIRKCHEQQAKNSSSSSSLLEASQWRHRLSQRESVSTSPDSSNQMEHPEYELFDMSKLLDRVAWLVQKPVDVTIQVTRFQTTVDMMSLVDASEKLFERVVFGREPVSKGMRPSTSNNSYMYGIRVGRKPRKLLSSSSSTSTTTTHESPSTSPSPSVRMPPRLFGVIKPVLAFLKQHLACCTSDVSGRLCGNGTDCAVVLELEDFHMIARNSMQFWLQPLPVALLGAFRVETQMISSSTGSSSSPALEFRVSLVEEAEAQSSCPALLSAVLGSFSTELVLDLERLLQSSQAKDLVPLHAMSLGFGANGSTIDEAWEQTTGREHHQPFAFFRSSEFTRFVAKANNGRLSTCLVPWVHFISREVESLIQRYCPEHLELFHTCRRHCLEGIACKSLEIQFHLVCTMLQQESQNQANVGGDDNLFVSLCGAAATTAMAAGSAAALQPQTALYEVTLDEAVSSNKPSLVYRNEWKLLKMATDVDDLFMRWIDGSCPGHSSDPSCL